MNVRAFSQNSLTSTWNANSNVRVMSTPTWPVPYYQRAFRHPALTDEHKGNITYANVPVHDTDVIFAKELLKLEGNGYVVEAIEQSYDIATYKTQFRDSAPFSHAYTDDLLDCLGVAHEQNVQLLAENDLNDVFN